MAAEVVNAGLVKKSFVRDLDKLKIALIQMTDMVDDAEERQFSDRSIKDWLGKLVDANLTIDDIMDKCFYELFGYKPASDQLLCFCLSAFHPKRFVLRYKIDMKIEKVRKRLEEIDYEGTQFHLSEMVPERRSRVIERPQTTSLISEPQVYGREEDTAKILNFLIGDADVSHSEDLLVYPIVGMGGLGKTTLAQLIFNHEKIVPHFDLRIWVCVSEDLKTLTKAIIEKITGRACEYLTYDSRRRKLEEYLRQKRYLLVLDDVWDSNLESWLELKSVLTCGAKGASVLITTRLRVVASNMGTVPPYELSGLSDHYCWELFRHQAFGPNEVEQEELVTIGKGIVKKCGGMPLTAKVLGNFLRFKRKEREWLVVKEKNIFQLLDIRNSIMSSLILSYLDLPRKFRRCFTYCAIFPKGGIIEKRHLLELWMANRLIPYDFTWESFPDKDDYNVAWNELYNRSFFHDIETDKFGNVTVFKMHDHLYDLAQSVAEDVCCVTDESSVTSLPERIHHLSYQRNSTERAISSQLEKNKSLRTCILQGPHTTAQLLPHVLKCYSLRVLQCQPKEELPSSIGDLKLLRYLNLSGGEFKILPESVCNLWILQTLKLDGCQFLQKLPDNLIHLRALKRLTIRGCPELQKRRQREIEEDWRKIADFPFVVVDGEDSDST